MLIYLANLTFSIPIGVIIGAAIFVSLLFVTIPPSGGSWLPPTVMLEAVLTGDRLSHFKIISFMRFILRQVHSLLSIHHNIVPDASHVERVYVKNHDAFDVHAMNAAMLGRIFGYDFGGKTREEYIELHHDSMKAVSRYYLNEAAVTSTLSRGNIGAKVSSLVSYTEDPIRQQLWERFANIKVLVPNDSDQRGVVEADLESLLKFLISSISIPLQYGEDFLQREPSLLWDWDCFANQAVRLLALGIPSWVPIKSFQQGIAARNRMVDSITSVYRQIRHCNDSGTADDSADMSDVSQAALDRFEVYDRHGLSMKAIGQVELSLLWAQNKNTQQLFFWFIFYIYSVPDLVQSLRHEVASSGVIATTNNDIPQITKLDISIIGKRCPTLKSTFLEAFRLSEESVLFRRVTSRVALEDDKGHAYLLRPGSWLSISTCLTKHDPSIYPRPLEFIPDRFIETDNSREGQKVASYKTLRPWGLGPAQCKGRSFAEKELLAIAACIITLWDIEPAVGTWKHPGFKTGATVLAPEESVRVCIKRRVL